MKPITHPEDEPAAVDVAQVLIKELLGTALWLFDVTTTLLDDLPDDVFPGEDSGEVLVEMLAGSCRPSIEAAKLANDRKMLL
jgi:hypothetical protein